MHSYPVHDLHLPSTYLHFPKKHNKLCLFCRLNLLNFSSSDKLVSKRKCKHKNEISHFCPNLFISLTYILASGSTEIKREKESGPAAKTCKPGTSGVSSTPKTLNYKGKDKRKITFS